MTFKVLTLNNISVKGLDRLPRDRYEVASEITHPDAILLRSFNMHEMEFPVSLKAVGRAGAGVNNIPVEKLSRMGVPVFNAPGANANAVKELVIAGMLLACRNICQAWHYTATLDAGDGGLSAQVEAGKKQYVGFELPGRTLGVVGLGAIGVKVANAARSLGMRVIGYDPTITVARAWQLSADVEQATSIDDLMGKVDFLTFHVPLVDSTRAMINAERIRLMRDGVVIMNFARDGIVDDSAVLEALDQGKVYAYVSDFPADEIRCHPRVIALPHLGASTREAEENCAVMVADEVREYLENGNVRNSVNLPRLNLPRKGAARLAIVNSNVPDMVAKMSSDLGKAGVNIVHMVNESNGSVAYTLLDTETVVASEIVDRISTIEGVLKVRVI
ncbi:MAG: 3-phosphoglycerate dehydrogenase family protein [Pseudomonadota bacterium]|nr:3-phosphoglycerate dehydrogenase family protein [Pseudomonadota bacterium]